MVGLQHGKSYAKIMPVYHVLPYASQIDQGSTRREAVWLAVNADQTTERKAFFCSTRLFLTAVFWGCLVSSPRVRFVGNLRENAAASSPPTP